MYSYEDRKGAVELYIQYRRDAAATVRAVGLSLEEIPAPLVPSLCKGRA